MKNYKGATGSPEDGGKLANEMLECDPQGHRGNNEVSGRSELIQKYSIVYNFTFSSHTKIVFNSKV